MKIGLLADTHDNIVLIEKAIRRLNEEKVDIVLHAGDYVAPFSVMRFQNLDARLIGVIGNNDGDHVFLRKRFAEIKSAELHDFFTSMTLDKRRIALLHGEHTKLLESLIGTQHFDAIIHGHTHQASIKQKGITNIINPGETCGYLSGKSTIGILNTSTLDTDIIHL